MFFYLNPKPNIFKKNENVLVSYVEIINGKNKIKEQQKKEIIETKEIIPFTPAVVATQEVEEKSVQVPENTETFQKIKNDIQNKTTHTNTQEVTENNAQLVKELTTLKNKDKTEALNIANIKIELKKDQIEDIFDTSNNQEFDLSNEEQTEKDSKNNQNNTTVVVNSEVITSFDELPLIKSNFSMNNQITENNNVGIKSLALEELAQEQDFLDFIDPSYISELKNEIKQKESLLPPRPTSFVQMASFSESYKIDEKIKENILKNKWGNLPLNVFLQHQQSGISDYGWKDLQELTKVEDYQKKLKIYWNEIKEKQSRFPSYKRNESLDYVINLPISVLVFDNNSKKEKYYMYWSRYLFKNKIWLLDHRNTFNKSAYNKPNNDTWLEDLTFLNNVSPNVLEFNKYLSLNWLNSKANSNLNLNNILSLGSKSVVNLDNFSSHEKEINLNHDYNHGNKINIYSGYFNKQPESEERINVYNQIVYGKIKKTQ